MRLQTQESAVNVQTAIRWCALTVVLGSVPLILPRARAQAPAPRTVRVSGHGTDRADSALVHAEEQTAQGTLRISTQIVELEGDLRGRVLYQVTTRIDSARHMLTNTGRQVYSGTVAGSAPVMLYDDRFRFEDDLAAGTGHGAVYLTRHLGGPAVSCLLTVNDSGRDAHGNPQFTYTGNCTFAASGAP